MISESTWWLDSRKKWNEIEQMFKETGILDFAMLHTQCGFCDHFDLDNPDEETIEEYGNDNACCTNCPAFQENICANMATPNKGRTIRTLMDMAQKDPLTNEIEIKRTKRLIGEVSAFIDKHKPGGIK